MSHYRASEIALGCLCVIWGLWLVAFGTYHTSPVLAPFRDWQVPEWIMVLYPLVSGMALLFSSHKWRRRVHLVMCPFWFFIAAAIFETDHSLTAAPVYLTISALHAIRFVLGNHAP